jgi:hypothetical protein
MGQKMKSNFVELEISRHPWATLRKLDGTAEQTGFALFELAYAANVDAAKLAYWKIENHVVVQGQLFESALHVVPCLMALLLEDRPSFVRISALELLFQIVMGEADEEEVSRGNADLGNACRAKAREGLWLLYRELLMGEREAAREILEVIEPELDRLKGL